jgi:uncharacterized protein (DUF885 family)
MQNLNHELRRESNTFRSCIAAVLFGVTLICGSCSRPANSVGGSPIKPIADAYWEFWLRTTPEMATQLGEYRYNDQLSEYSIAHYAAVKSDASALVSRLKAIEPAKLNESDRLDHAILMSTLEDLVRSIDLKMYEMPVDQFFGVQIAVPQIATTAPFDSVKHYEDYIARMRQVPGRFEQMTATMRQGMQDKLMPPKYLLEKTVVQCHNLATPEGEKNPFSAPVLHFPDGIPEGERKRLHDALIAVVDGEVRPAYQKLETFLAKEYAPHGRADEGYWALPDGDERYRFNVHTQTTTNMTPEEIHQLGLAQVADLEAQILALAKKAGYPDAKSFTKAVYADPKLKATSREQILNNFRNYIGNMEPKLPQLFGRLPKGKLIVTSVPEYMEKDSSTQYIQGTPDGSRKGQVWVLTYDPQHHDVLDDEATAYHEGVPGHHLQIAIQLELPLDPFHRSVFYNAFQEGWALYAERLGKEVGFYQNPASDLGRLRSDLFRAIRLVVDTGVHYKRWKRGQMMDYFRQHFGDPQEVEVDRYVAIPGQALGYKIGQLKILELRKRAQDRLGAAFDIRAFHDRVLGAGALPLDLLESRVDEWIAGVQEKK